jgi:tetratricopeptide (TPR) repeat protein
MKILLKTILLLFLISSCSSCSNEWNFYTDFGNKETKIALLEEAKFRIDKAQYEEAIELLDILFEKYPKDYEIVLLRSSAYAGAAKIGLLDTASSILDLSIDTNILDKPLAAYLVLVQNPSEIELSYAKEALYSLNNFELANNRTNEMNMYLSVISYAGVASIFSVRADINPNDNIVDEEITCNDFSDEDILDIIFIYAIAKQSVVKTKDISAWSKLRTQIINFTDAVSLLGVDLSVTSKDSITNSECETIKSFVLSGLTGSINACTCNL